ncbi:MAG: MBL fold metallo-hydrolase [Flavobacteriales bacterium]
MKVEQLYTSCLAEAAYYIESNGEVAIIDPLRDTDVYMEKANAAGARIKYVFETHFHADFVSGHIDLAQKSGATIVFGPTAETGFDSYAAKDNEEFKIGNLTLIALHTPGHTPESTTWLLKDENGKDYCIFSGDTLFIGDVGRPDLAVKSNLTQEDLAGMLYDSLRNKIMPLADEVIVYPGHGAGSACGKNISSETHSTIGEQKKTNYALREMSKEEFIKEVTTGILPPPKYFPEAVALNKKGYDPLQVVMQKGLKPLSIQELMEELSSGALVIDTRSKTEFIKGFIPGTIFIGLDGQFATWAATLFPKLDTRIVIIAENGKKEEAIVRLARVGFDNIVGFLDGGINSWIEAGKDLDKIGQVSAEQLTGIVANQEINLLDSRKPTEFDTQHAVLAKSYPLDYIFEHLHDLNKEETYYIHCRSGYRSLVAASIMKANGYKDLIDVAGGFIEMEKTAIPLSATTCTVSR